MPEPQEFSVTKLREVCDPFLGCWFDAKDPVTMEAVRLAVQEGRLESEPYSNEDWYLGNKHWNAQRHVERIAYLVANPLEAGDPIEFDVISDEEIQMQDGNHRLAAAIVSGNTVILGHASGFENAIEGFLA